MEENQFRMVCPKCGSHSFTVRRDQRAYVHKSQPFELVFSCRCGKQLFGDQIQEEYDRQKAEWDVSDKPVTSSADAELIERQHEEERRKEQLRRAMEYRRKYLAEKRLEQADAERRRKEEEDRRWRDKVAQVEAEERGQRAAAAAAAANGGKAVKPKPRPKPTPPAPAPAPKPVVAPPAAKVAPPPAPEPPKPAVRAAEPAPAPAPVPKPAAVVDADDVDPEHPHAEFMPYLLSGQFQELFPDATPPDVKDPMLCVWPPCEKNRRKKSKYCSRECSNKNARWRHKMRKKEDE